MSSAKRIGGDWVENVDPTSGKTYYANLVTQETSWEYPAELQGQQEGAAAAGDAAAASGSGSGDWMERDDPSSGRKYYYNTVTRETTWTKPEGFGEGGGGGGGDAAAATAGGGAADEAANWHERTDPSSGRPYYYNSETRETSWTKPACMEASAATPAAAPAAAAAATPAAATPAAAPAAAAAGGTPDAAAKSDGAAADDAAAPAKATTNRFAKLRAFAKEKGAEAAASKPSLANTVLAAAKAAKEGEEGADGETPAGGGAAAGVDAGADDAGTAEAKADEDGVDEEALLESIEEKTMEEYAESHFNLNRKGLLGKKTKLDKILSWKSDLIRTSLRQLNADLAAEAVQAFRNVTGFMGDRSSGKTPMDHALKLMNNILSAPEELRDEIYCQICKQTRRNPRAESTEKGWQLMAICVATFPPSAEFFPYLASYCRRHISEPGEVGKYARFAAVKLFRAVELGQRREIPTTVEIEAVRVRQPVIVRVYFLDGSYKLIPVEPWTTAAEFDRMVARELNIQDAAPFNTFEVSSEDEERVLDEDERIMDLCAYWQEKAKKGKSAVTEEYKFVYKVRLFFDVEETDLAAVSLMYIQAVHDVVDARYPCSEQDCITLAALQVQEEHGNYSGDAALLTGHLHRYLPAKFIDKDRNSELEENILKLYAKLSGYSSQEAKLSYLDFVKSWKIYGSAYFFVEPQNSRDFPSEVVLAINNKAILVVDPETKSFLAEYPYAEVVTWGHSPNSFVVVTGNLLRQTKVYFKSDQGKEMNQMVHRYVNSLLGTDGAPAATA